MSRLLDALHRSKLDPESYNALASIVGLGDSRPISPPAAGLESVPAFSAFVAPEGRLEAFTMPYGFAAEQFRALGARLQHLAESRQIKTILVTSSSFQEGKSLVCLNLAVTLAKRAGKRVLLVEGDLRKPALSRSLDLPALPGLSDWVKGTQPITDFLCRISDLDLWLLPAGGPCEQPLEIIQSPRMLEMLSKASEHFDWVLMDSAPLLVADSTILSRAVDGTLVVVRQECTEKKRLHKSLAGLANVLGFVLNDATSMDPSDYKHYYIPRANGNGSGHRIHSEARQGRPGPTGAGAKAS